MRCLFGNMLILILILLALPALSAGRGDWWMFRHDAQHTGRSAFSGPATPYQRWSCTLGGTITASPAIGQDGTIYIGSDDYNLYAVNPDGMKLWAFPTKGKIVNSSPAIGSDGTIYVGSDDHNLYAITPNGTQKWAFTTGGSILYSSPVIGKDGTIYIGSGDGKLYAVNQDGTKKWVALAAGALGTPAIGTNDVILVGSDDGNMYEVNPDGTQRGVYTKLGLTAKCSSIAVGSDGSIYLAGPKFVLGLNGDTSLKWFSPHGYNCEVNAPAIGKDGTVYFSTAYGTLDAYNGQSGDFKWSYNTGSVYARYLASSPAIGSDGTLYLGSESGKLVAVNQDGSKKWEFDTKSTYIDSSPAIGADGTIYVGLREGKLLAIGKPYPQLALTNTVSPAQAHVGDTVTYKLACQNTGSAAATNLTLSDVLPTGLVYVTGSGGSYNAASSTLTWALGTMNAGASASVSFQAKLDPALSFVSTVSNTATRRCTEVPTAMPCEASTLTVLGWTVTPSSTILGNISPNNPQTVNNSGSVTFTATANDGYTVNCWYLDGSKTPCQTGGSQYILRNVTANHQVHVDFTQAIYTVIPTAGPHGSIAPNTPQQTTYNKILSFFATPDAGYQTDTWYLNGTAIPGEHTAYGIQVTENCTLNVTFTAVNYTITPSAGQNGTITPNTPQHVAYNGSVTFTAAANAGYTGNWYIDGNGPYQVGGSTFTMTNITANHTISVDFQSRPQYTITLTAGPNGTFTPSSPQKVYRGESVTFTAVANAGYTVDLWYVLYAGSYYTCQAGGGTLTLTNVSANDTYKVTFKPWICTVSPSVTGNGTITPSIAQQVNYGQDITFTATANARCTVDCWSIDNASTPAQTGGSQFILRQVTADHAINVAFAEYAIATPSAGPNGTISPSAPQTVLAWHTVTFTATANAGYTVDTWYQDGIVNQNGGNTYTYKASLLGNHTVRVTFKPLTFLITPTAGTNGNISPNTAQTITYGQNVTFTATANAGFTVDVWQVDGVNAQTGGAQYTLNNVTKPCAVRVLFKVITNTVTPAADANGAISPSSPQTIAYGQNVTFTATANAGYTVDVWQVDGVKAQTGGAQYTLNNVTQPHNVKVLFTALTFTVTPSFGAHSTITPSSPQTIAYGKSITFTATANAGFTVYIWQVDDVVVQMGGAQYTLNNVTKSCAVEVQCTMLAYTITPTAGLNGAITPSSPQTTTYGKSVLFTASANAGYTVDVWQVDGVNVQTGGTKYTVSNVMANHAVNVLFKALKFTITPSAGTNGRISPDQPQIIVYGGSVTFTALPSAGYQVQSWTLDGTVKRYGGTTYTVSNVTASHHINVTFVIPNTPPTITQVPYLAVNKNGGPQSIPLFGITPGDADDAGQTVTISALSSNPAVIPLPTVSYTSPATTGTLMFTPVTDATGTALITVKVQDNGGTVSGGRDTTTMAFLVTVRAPSGLFAWGNNSAGQYSFATAISTVVTVAGGWYHTVALKQDGTVQCWGGTNDGEANVPAGLSGVTAVAAGGTHTVALLNSGKVIAWGNNRHGECTIPSAALSGVAAIAAGDSHTVALKYDGTVLCWGSNASGQCTVLSGLSGVVAIAAGAQHTVALKGNGTVVAWGDNSYGQRAVPSNLAGVQAIAAGAYHTLALTSTGQVIGWGANDQGQSTAQAGLSAVQIAAGKYHSVAVTANGTVVCWGAGKTNTGMTPEFGQSMVPAGLYGVRAVAAGSVHTVVICPVMMLSSLTLSANMALSNQPIGTAIGTFATLPNILTPFKYMLVSGTGSTDNTSFTIDGNVLKTKVVLDSNKKSSLSIRVRTTDRFGDYLEKTFTITVPPTITGVNLSPSTVTEFSPAGTLVGTFTASPDSNFPFSYLLVNGAGSADNALFTIDGNKLKLATTAPDALKQPTCSIRVRVVDRYAQYAEAPMTITVLPQSRPDLTIFNGTSWLGSGVYNADGSGQTCQLTCNASGTGYSFAVLNRGASADSFQFTIAGVDPAWTVACYDLAASTTTPLAGTSWTTPSLAPNTARTYFVSVLPGATVTSGAQLSLLLTAKSVRNAQRLDAVKAITTRQTVQPPITGITLNPYTVTEYAPVGTVIGAFATLPAGNAPFTYTLVSGTGSDDNALFTLAGSQLTLAKIAPDALLQASCKIRVRVSDKYSQSAELPLTLPLVARYRPDLEIYDGKAWVGQGIFNADATNQTVKLTCNASGTAYSIAVLNMGASADTFQLTVTGLDSAWKVYCYDAGFTPPKVLDGTSWTTPAIAGYAVRTYVVYPVPTSTVVSGQVLTLLITAKSVGNAARLDAVKATTTRQ